MRNHGVTFLLMAAGLGIVAAAGDDPPCRPYLVPCNYGDLYSGTVHWRSTLGDEKQSVTAHVTRGKVRCEGSRTGDGLLAVEAGKGTEDDPGQLWYSVAVACPEAGGQPARMQGEEFNTYKQPRKGWAKLEGTIDEENPDADPVNGVTGTVHMDWSLSR